MSIPNACPPPALDREFLFSKMIENYKSHQHCGHLIENLITEYMNLWHLALQYPRSRIVAPGCILAVGVVHHKEVDRYYRDVVQYFNKPVEPTKFAWKGLIDIQGVLDTVNSYTEYFNCVTPPEPWNDLVSVYSLRKSNRPKILH